MQKSIERQRNWLKMVNNYRQGRGIAQANVEWDSVHIHAGWYMHQRRMVNLRDSRVNVATASLCTSRSVRLSRLY